VRMFVFVRKKFDGGFSSIGRLRSTSLGRKAPLLMRVCLFVFLWTETRSCWANFGALASSSTLLHVLPL